MPGDGGASRSAWWERAAPGAASLADVVDPVIDDLAPSGRAELADVWQKRGSLELRVASSFSSLAVQIFEHGAQQSVYEMVGEAVRDEVRHAEICVGIASRYRGGDPIWPEPAPTHVPPFAPTTGAMHAALWVVAMSCINETAACAVLEASLETTKTALVRAGLQSILTDEIDHARLGWAFLGSSFVSPVMRGALAKWLPRLLSAKFRELVEEDAPLAGEGFVGHGILPREPRRAVVHAAIADVILPGFQRAGIDTSLGEEWARTAFERDVPLASA
jgi:hypothetical protein